MARDGKKDDEWLCLFVEWNANQDTRWVGPGISYVEQGLPGNLRNGRQLRKRTERM